MAPHYMYRQVAGCRPNSIQLQNSLVLIVSRNAVSKAEAVSTDAAAPEDTIETRLTIV